MNVAERMLDLPIGMLPGGVPDDPVVPPRQQAPPRPVPPPATGRQLAQQLLEYVCDMATTLRRMLELQESSVKNFLGAGSVAGGSSVGTVAATIINANPKRKGLSVQNIGEAGNLTVGPGVTAPIAGTGIVLAPGASWDGRISGMVWKGSISVIGSQGGVEYSFLEVP